MNYPPFYIGQDVVYITGINLPKDSVWKVVALTQMSCGCWLVDVGIGKTTLISPTKYVCSYCKTGTTTNPERINWFYAKSFAPVIEKFEAISFSKIIEKELISLN